VIVAGIFLSCKRHLKPDDTKNVLMTTMEKYLNGQKDTTKVRFHVMDVIFYEDKTVYDCQFRVEMKEPRKDTVGAMYAWISKDFQTVRRKY